MKRLLFVLALSSAAAVDFGASPAWAYDQLSAADVTSELPGRRYQLRMMRPMDLVFGKDGTFRVGHHEPCSGGEKSKYSVGRHGRVTLEFRNCDGKRRSTMYFDLYRKGGALYARDTNTSDYYRFVKR